MDLNQKKNERAVGDHFIEWLNTETDSNYRFIDRPDRAPDLLYSSTCDELLVEVTAAYYDREHATFIWKGIRGAKDAPLGWSGFNPNSSLSTEIFKRVAEKSKKGYGDNTLLLIEVPPGVTSAEDLAVMLGEQTIPTETPFVGIYVVGIFPITNRSSGGYRVIPLKMLKRVSGC